MVETLFATLIKTWFTKIDLWPIFNYRADIFINVF